eukprot:CAMPEP_0194278760 /NCGR_PEP_ID=MMETSP0169-20130528/12040_1 /TAXON_ID=218684 /ORGANISM="Corethron pennatum, Strain L29A3" /LENGTH=127 /DNA_ID=CAMNT_0039023019 /DNA_START=163 /DNA_END=546 /DNA_ORIENTATION=+
MKTTRTFFTAAVLFFVNFADGKSTAFVVKTPIRRFQPPAAVSALEARRDGSNDRMKFVAAASLVLGSFPTVSSAAMFTTVDGVYQIQEIVAFVTLFGTAATIINNGKVNIQASHVLRLKEAPKKETK